MLMQGRSTLPADEIGRVLARLEQVILHAATLV